MFKSLRYLPALVLLAGVLMGTSACASYDYYGRQRTGVYRNDIEQRAYDNGYREGVKRGDEDGRKGRAFSFERHDDALSHDLHLPPRVGVASRRAVYIRP